MDTRLRICHQFTKQKKVAVVLGDYLPRSQTKVPSINL
ncbi:MAG: hypothetical protein ACI9UA_005435 [Pseudoalteromonas tetraodonis]|jgi:hypothetical protein